MPMATAVSFSHNADVSQAGLRNFENVIYTLPQVPSPDNFNAFQLGATQHTFSSDVPYLTITEQPKSKWRYRYQSEKGSHGPLPGFNSSTSRKTFPTVKVVNFPENVKVYVKASLWTIDKANLHVHKLYGSNCRDDGTCTVEINADGIAVFQDMTILFVAKKDVPEILFQRMMKEGNLNIGEKQALKLASEKTKAMNLNAVRICFEAFYFNQNKTERMDLCSPLFSEPVANLRSTKDGDLKICRMSLFTGVAIGGDEVFLLCCKVDKKDIQVRFFEPTSSWEDFGKFTEADVHQQCAIVFQTPPYRQRDITDPVKVFLQLQRKNGDASDPKEFTYIPCIQDDERIVKKRKTTNTYQQFGSSRGDINRNFRAQESNPVLQNQCPPMRAESVESSLGSTCSSGAWTDDQLDPYLDLSSLTDENSCDNIDLDFFNLEDDTSVVVSDLLLSQANVSQPQFYLPADPVSGQMLSTDAVVSEVKLPENLGDESCVENDSRVKTEEVEEAFRKLIISSRSVSVTEDSDSPNSETHQLKVIKEETVKVGQDTTAKLPKTREFQPRAVSDTLLKRIWCGLCIAVRKGNPFDFLRNLPQLIGFCDEERNTLLHVAVSQQPPSAFIIDSLLRTAEEIGYPLVTSANKNHKTPLHIAVKSNKSSIVRLLLQYGADPSAVDRQGFSSFHLAIYARSKECLHELLHKTNYKSPPETFSLDSTDHHGLSPLHYAAKEELVECITLLCLAGADVNIKSKKDGRTPLHHAALQDCKVAKILLAKKITDVNAQDYGGNTPLHLACSSNNTEVVIELMIHGADPFVCNYESYGLTPYNFAERNEEIKEILLSSHDIKKPESGMHYSGASCAASCTPKVYPQSSDSTSEGLVFQCAPLSKEKSQVQGDSGYNSGKLSVLSDEIVQKLSKLLDPPSDSWRSLMLYTIMDEDFERNIHKLTSKPTKAILSSFLNNGGTAKSLASALEAAELYEARNIVIQHISS